VLGLVALLIQIKKATSKTEQTNSPKVKPYALAWMCGVLNVTGITLLFMSFEEASKTNSNLGVSSAMLSGCILWGLFGSKVVYKEQISNIQLLGALVLMVSISTIAIMSDARQVE
jgi:uncharacterized membrane protein YdcZ (DUF606 family)